MNLSLVFCDSAVLSFLKMLRVYSSVGGIESGKPTADSVRYTLSCSVPVITQYALLVIGLLNMTSNIELLRADTLETPYAFSKYATTGVEEPEYGGITMVPHAVASPLFPVPVMADGYVFPAKREYVVPAMDATVGV